jgi:protein-S-isoprenylcysteine O-methyltransferase Ste14
MAHGVDHGQALKRLDRRRLTAQLVAFPIVMALLLFLPAGTWRWVRGWLFFLVFLLVMALAALYLWWVNPEIFVARSRIHEGTKRWDRILMGILGALLVASLPVVGLDAGRFRWSVVPWWACLLGYTLLLVGIGIAARAEAVNRFFEWGVRIQAERGHTVIETGPYAVVRHPGYVGTCLLLVGGALALGSWWALVPAGLASLVLLVRTRWEDQTLQAELAGYKGYTQRVRFRWIPGVW